MHVRSFVVSLAVAISSSVSAESTVHVIYMGGNDCPPCVVWRQTELPKLQQMPAFKSIKFSYVTKAIRSVVPPSIFLPDEVMPLKQKLDTASGGNIGSPQIEILVNGEVFDYSWGTPTAESFESKIISAQQGILDGWQRCLQRGTRWECVKSN